MPEPDLQVSLVDYNHDWDELMDTFWHAWKTPMQATGELTFAHLGAGSEAETQAFADVKKNLLAAAKSNPDAYWLKCVDRATGKIVGGASFTHHRTNPYRGPPKKFEAGWFEEGTEKRQLSEEMYEQLHAWRRHVMGKEHASTSTPPLRLLMEISHRGPTRTY
jgi:hypothetical protein